MNIIILFKNLRQHMTIVKRKKPAWDWFCL